MFSLVLPAMEMVRVKSIDVIYEWIEMLKYKCDKHGINKKQLILDPGIGFIISANQSLELIQNITQLQKSNIPICIGHSRKSYIRPMTRSKTIYGDIETLSVSLFLQQAKIDYIRVHNVEIHKKAFDIASNLYFDS
jgi:dihydropteroate synthase